MGRYGLNDDAQLVLHRCQRGSLQHLLSSNSQEWASPLTLPGAHDSLGLTLRLNAIQQTWLARERAN
jgi:hypothetical protein